MYNCIKKNKIPRNKHNWRGEWPMLRKWWHWWKKFKIALRNGKIYLARGLAKLVLLKWPYYPKKFLAILTIAFFIELKQIILKLVWKHTHTKKQIASVQLLTRVRLFVTPWIAARQASLSITNSWSSPKLMSIESVMPSSHLILCRPLLLLPSILPSIRVFSNESTLHMRWPKYWSFSFSISSSNEHPGLISFRMDLLDLLAVQGTLKSLLQHHSSKASILCCSAFFTVQLSHPYLTTGKTIALTRWTFVGKVMSLLLNMLSRLVIAFLPRSKRLLISWLKSPSLVILEPPKNSLTLFPLFPHLFPMK